MFDITSEFKMMIGGQSVGATKTIDVFNPSTGEVFAQAPDCSREQLDEAIRVATKAFPAWKETPINERAQLLVNAAELLEQHADQLASLFTREHGRPVDGTKAEILGAAVWIKMVAQMRPPVHVHEDSEAQRVETQYVPLGVICAISPWNFPVNLSIWKIAPALLTGNTIVLKPSPFTPLCMLKIGELLRDVFPAGVLNIISGGDDLGPWMTSHPGFAKISFTGSSETGKRVMASAAKDLKRLTLELGGNDAAIVLPDVNVDEIAAKIFFGAFANTSQICVATKRLYVHEDVYDALRDRLVAIAKMTKVGDGSEQGTVLGPIQNKRQYERVVDLLESAKSDGLKLLQGSDIPNSAGYFIPITIVDNPPESSRVVQEEAFGPILPMMKFSDVDEVVRLANDSEYGLAGAVWSADTEKALSIANALETGTVWINHNLNLRPDTPFAGHKHSGFGVENGMEGLLEYTAPKSIYLAK